eukprot:gene6387-12923_t
MGNHASHSKIRDIDSAISARCQANQESNSAVEEFVEYAYNAGPKVDGLRLIFENGRAREAFIKFILSYEDEADFFEEVENFMKDSTENSILAARKIVDKYQNPSAININDIFDNVSAYLEVHKRKSVIPIGNLQDYSLTTIEENENEFDEQSETILDSVYNATNEAIVMIFLKRYPKFIGSEQYKEWRDREAQEVIAIAPLSTATSTTPLRTIEKSRSGSKLASIVPIDQSTSQKTPRSPDSFASRCFQFINPTAVDRLFGTGSWLTTFVSAAEGLPICVTLADADKSRPGFPLIYVNKVFEFSTGFDREKIRGRNCKFLQSQTSERSSVRLISQSLANMAPVRVVITNTKKDGTQFRNLLALKPVVDLDGNYCYVVGVQFDISSPIYGRSTVKMMQLVDRLLAMIPDIVPFGGCI